MVFQDHCRMDPCLKAIPQIPHYGKQLDTVTELTGKKDIIRGQGRDALPVDVIKRDRNPGHNGNKDSQFVGGIRTVHIQCGWVFGIAQFYCLLDHLVIGQCFPGHFCQDVV